MRKKSREVSREALRASQSRTATGLSTEGVALQILPKLHYASPKYPKIVAMLGFQARLGRL